MNNKARAEQIIGLLDSLSLELKDLVNTEEHPRAAARIEDLRTHMGFEKGGYVGFGNDTLDTLLEDGAFDEVDEDDEEDE
jgi:hypothetical protein